MLPLAQALPALLTLAYPLHLQQHVLDRFVWTM